MKTHLRRRSFMAFMLGTLLLVMQSAYAQQNDDGTAVIYKQDGLDVSTKTSASFFCSTTQKSNPGYFSVSARYNIEHKERSKLIAPSYESFVRDKVIPGMIKLCGNLTITEISMSMLKTEEQKAWDIMTFNIADNGKAVKRSGYHPSVFAQANMSKEELAAMMPSTAPTSLPTQSGGKQLYKDGKITIYAREEVWCHPKNFRSKVRPSSNAGLDIVVPVDYDALHGWLRTNYGRFDLKVIKPLADEACFPGSDVSAKFYQDGEAAYLEDVRYGLKKSRSTLEPEQFAVLNRQAGPSREARLAVINKTKDIQDVWGLPCEGPFCALPGGAYFQAILAGDKAAVQNMDGMIDQRVGNWSPLGRDASVPKNQRQDYSLLPVIADTYFYNYQQSFMLGCPDDGLVKKTYSYVNPTFEMPDYGDYKMPDMGGEVDTATYVLRPEFVPLCDKVCDAFGGAFDRDIVKFIDYDAAKQTLNGVYEMSDLFQCSNDAVKLFEKNLIKFTTEYMGNKTGWLNAAGEYATQNQAKSKPVESVAKTAPQAVQKDTLAPSVQPAPQNAPNVSTVQPKTKSVPATPKAQPVTKAAKVDSRMSEAERYENMNAEIAALSETYTARLNKLSQEFQKNMMNVSDTAQRSKMLKSFQAEMANLSAEAKRETQKVKDKYKNN